MLKSSWASLLLKVSDRIAYQCVFWPLLFFPLDYLLAYIHTIFATELEQQCGVPVVEVALADKSASNFFFLSCHLAIFSFRVGETSRASLQFFFA